jgi:hypothetical protein
MKGQFAHQNGRATEITLVLPIPNHVVEPDLVLRGLTIPYILRSLVVSPYLLFA